MTYLNKQLKSVVLLFMLTILLTTGKVIGKSFDHTYTSYQSLLSTFMENGLVDYSAMQVDKILLENAIADLSALTKDQFDSFTRDQKVAYLINAYNLYTIQSIIDAYPVSSIKKIKGVWNKRKFKIAGEELTLDNVEHDLLRKTFHEPRIHVAVVCASISCPELWDHPFTPNSLESQLELRSSAFANDTTRNRVDTASGIIYLSRIFKWYGSDFESYRQESSFSSLGKKKAGVLAFLSQYWPQSIQMALQNKKLRTKYLKYDWNLNEPVRKTTAKR